MHRWSMQDARWLGHSTRCLNTSEFELFRNGKSVIPKRDTASVTAGGAAGDPVTMVKFMIYSIGQNAAPKRIALGSDAIAAIQQS
jgi:hypothetical protein